MTAYAKNLKCSAGQFKVFHVGFCTYTVERDGVIHAAFPDLSSAAACARRLHAASKAEAA